MKKLWERKTNPLFAVMVAFLLGFFLIADLDIRYIYMYALLGVLLVFGILLAGIWRPGMKLKDAIFGIWKKVTPIKACFLLIVAVVSVYSLLPNSNRTHLTISLLISMLMFTAYLLFMEPTGKGVQRAFAAIHVMSILFSLYIMVVMLWPDLFWKNIYPHLSKVSQEQADWLLPMGYGVPVGGSATYTDYVISIALLCNLARIFVDDAPVSKKRFAFIVLSSGLYISAILLMGRRSEVLAIGAAGLIMLVLHWKAADRAQRRRRLAAIGAILIALVVILTPFVMGGHMDRYVTLIQSILPFDPTPALPTDPSTGETLPPDPTDPTLPLLPDRPTADELTSGRIGLWKKAWELFKENPVFGIGWEQFMNHNKYEHEVHNTYLQWLCEAGIIGFILLMTPLVFMWLMTLKRTLYYRRKGKNAPYGLKKMNFVSLGMQTFLLAVNLIDPAFYHLNYFCFFALVVVLEDTAARLDETARSDKQCLLKAIWESVKLF